MVEVCLLFIIFNKFNRLLDISHSINILMQYLNYNLFILRTFEEWTKLRQSTDRTSPCELTNCELHVQQRNPTDDKDQKIWHQKHTCNNKSTKKQLYQQN